MRRPWAGPPGTVRVRARRLIEPQDAALRAADLREGIAAECRRAAQVRAEALALRILSRSPAPVPAELTAELTADLPLRQDGSLHAEAFVALAESRAWQERDELVREVLAGNGGRS